LRSSARSFSRSELLQKTIALSANAFGLNKISRAKDTDLTGRPVSVKNYTEVYAALQGDFGVVKETTDYTD
jgi:hypothetical protein